MQVLLLDSVEGSVGHLTMRAHLNIGGELGVNVGLVAGAPVPCMSLSTSVHS